MLANEATLHPEDLYRSLVENIPEVFYRYEATHERKAVYLSSRVESLTGYPADRFLADWYFWYEIIHPDDREIVHRQVKRAIRRAKVFKAEYRLVHRDGSTRHVIDVLMPSTVPTAGPQLVDGMLIEITDRKEAEIEIAKQKEQLQALSRRLVQVQEIERRQISRELHDVIGQSLTALRFLLDSGGRNDLRDLKVRNAKAQRVVKDLMERVRGLSLDLRPAMLDDLGLVPALLWHVQRFESETGVTVRFEHGALKSRFPSEFETAAYRIVQEALTNVARHARVDEASVILRREEGELRIEVADAGSGFDLKKIRADRWTNGIHGMMERAREWGGALSIDSAPGRGTVLVATLPIETVTDDDDGAAQDPRGG